MRILLVAGPLLLLLSFTAAGKCPAQEKNDTMSAGSLKLPYDFPMPKDASESMSPGMSVGDMIKTYEVPRSKEIVSAEERQLIEAAGWKILSDELSPRGTLRLKVEKNGVKIAVSVTGTSDRTAIIVTFP